MGSPRVTYYARPDATPEDELHALATVYRFVLERHARKKGGPETAPEDARKDKDARTCSHCT